MHRIRDSYANLKLNWVPYVGGKRESRRLLGDVILQEQDVMENHPFPDQAVPSSWWIDLHYPIQSDQFPGEEFRSKAAGLRFKGAYPVPYRCFYSRNIKNLFMGRAAASV